LPSHTYEECGASGGISSWSATLLAMVDAMHPWPRSTSAQVVQILGGVGNPSAEAHAAHLTRRMATLTRGEAFFLPAPGIAGSAETARIYLRDTCRRLLCIV